MNNFTKIFRNTSVASHEVSGPGEFPPTVSATEHPGEELQVGERERMQLWVIGHNAGPLLASPPLRTFLFCPVFRFL